MAAHDHKGRVEVHLGSHVPVEIDQPHAYYVSGSKRTGGLECRETVKARVIQLSLWEAAQLMETLPRALLRAAQYIPKEI